MAFFYECTQKCAKNMLDMAELLEMAMLLQP